MRADAAQEQAAPAREPGKQAAAGRWLSLSGACGLGSFLVLASTLVARNAYLFSTRIYENSDFAANTIAVLQAKHFDLLTGNYSKEGFYHPGPAFLYVAAAGEAFFHDLLHLVPTPWNGQLLAILLLNAALIAACVWVIARRAGSAWGALACLAVVLFFAAAHPLAVNSGWMPYVYFAPSLLLLVSAASVATGQTADLPLLALSAWLCINGQAEFLLFGPVIVIVAVGGLIVTRWRDPGGAGRVPARHWVTALAVSALLAFPIALNTVLHWPGQFGRYLAYGRAASGHLTHHSLLFSVEYTLRYWWPGRPDSTADGRGLAVAVVTGALALLLALRCPRPGLRRFLLGLLAMVALLTVLFVYYADKGIDDNDISQAYLGYFYWAAPLLVIVVAAAAAAAYPGGTADTADTADTAASPGRRSAGARVAAAALAALVVAGAVVAGTVPQRADDPDDPPAIFTGVPQLPHVVQTLAAQAHGRPVVLQITQNDWIETVGVIAYADRTGVRSCVVGAKWTILFRAQSICTPDEIRTGAVFSVRPAGHHSPLHSQIVATLPLTWITRRGVAGAQRP